MLKEFVLKEPKVHLASAFGQIGLHLLRGKY